MTTLDELWIAEAHDRLDAYNRGELDAVSVEEVFDEIENEMGGRCNRAKCGCNNAEGVG